MILGVNIDGLHTNTHDKNIHSRYMYILNMWNVYTDNINHFFNVNLILIFLFIAFYKFNSSR